MYAGLKAELKRIITLPHYDMNLNVSKPNANTCQYSFTITNPRTVPADTLFTITKEIVRQYRDIIDNDTGRTDTIPMHDEYNYSVSIKDATYRATFKDKDDYCELFELCQARQAFHKNPKNIAIMDFLSIVR